MNINFILEHHIYFSILAGFILDSLLGDPHCFPHPVKFMGKMISFLEKRLNKSQDSAEKQKFKGFILVFSVILLTFLISFIILYFSRKLNPYLFIILEVLITYQCLAARSLFDESMKVYFALKKGRLENARKALSMIVGRDTDILDEKGIIKAAVETIAENASDGVIAPLFYMILFGPLAGLIYKAINTMDSMIAYKNERFLHFGFCAAKLDDFVNFIPSRLCAVLMIFASLILPGFSFKNAIKIFLRDRKKHASPNSAQTESVTAGSLCVQLAGDTVYGGIVEKKQYIGDNIREVKLNDILKANVLMYASTLIILLSIMYVLSTNISYFLSSLKYIAFYPFY